MTLVQDAFTRLYPEKDSSAYEFHLRYSGRFSGYNANVSYRNKTYTFSLSKQWRSVSPDIQIGIIQHLLQKIFKTTRKTLEQDLYDSFLRNVHVSVPKERVDPFLKERFDAVNDQYFLGMVEMPNLEWGNKTFRKLGCYTYGKDTITISTVFKGISEKDLPLLDFVMYHEMLHKVHKFKTVNGKNYHHTPAFRKAEAEFENFDQMDDLLKIFLRKKRFKDFVGLD